MKKEKASRLYVQDLLDHLDAVGRFTVDGKASFIADDKTQFAVIRAYEIVGEICKQLPARFRDSHPQIDWSKLIGFRDYLAHHYDTVILDYVWNAVEDMPSLRAKVQAILDLLDNSST
jgi:uncharacterized protein with HEPN domain